MKSNINKITKVTVSHIVVQWLAVPGHWCGCVGLNLDSRQAFSHHAYLRVISSLSLYQKTKTITFLTIPVSRAP